MIRNMFAVLFAIAQLVILSIPWVSQLSQADEVVFGQVLTVSEMKSIIGMGCKNACIGQNDHCDPGGGQCTCRIDSSGYSCSCSGILNCLAPGPENMQCSGGAIPDSCVEDTNRYCCNSYATCRNYDELNPSACRISAGGCSGGCVSTMTERRTRNLCHYE